MSRQRVNIKLKAFDHSLLDRSVRSIVLTVRRAGAVVRGPIFLPRKVRSIILNRSPHIDKKSREQFGLRVSSRLLVLPSASPATVQSLTNLQLSAGVDVEIEVLGGDGGEDEE